MKQYVNIYKMEAKEYLEEKGFNTHPGSMVEICLVKSIMRQYAEAYHQAKLKEESYISFEDWKKRHLIDVNRFENTFLHDTEGWIEEHRLIEKYNDEVMNL